VVGFNHLFRGPADGAHRDQVFIQGHASPGIYARAFLEGRLGEADLDRFRREVGGGLPSYPHPRRSDARAPLRRHFEVDPTHLAVAALRGLAERGDVKAEVVADAIDRFGIDADAVDPRHA
jgi:pyruvate dehydrogenase complex dehydrogenase (E1) component